jgi:hypothetical protein
MAALPPAVLAHDHPRSLAAVLGGALPASPIRDERRRLSRLGTQSRRYRGGLAAATLGATLGSMQIRQFRDEGLGHLSTLVADETAGVAAVVDPRRDVDIYLAAARELDVRITHVVETHLHNDYVSGGRDLAALTSARHVIGAGAELRHDHGPVRDGETFDVGSLRFTSRDTPGHTPEHVAYAVADMNRAAEPLLLFTGGSLLVGARFAQGERHRKHAGNHSTSGTWSI